MRIVATPMFERIVRGIDTRSVNLRELESSE